MVNLDMLKKEEDGRVEPEEEGGGEGGKLSNPVWKKRAPIGLACLLEHSPDKTCGIRLSV